VGALLVGNRTFWGDDPYKGKPGEGEAFGGGWDGPQVVLTGDVHSHWAANIHERFDDPSSPPVGTELVTTSITSGGDGSESRPEAAEILAENPHIRFHNNRRGYVRTVIDVDELRADFKVVPNVARPGAAVETRASFVVVDREPTLHQA
jgi:alkaline phosphatase D